MLAVTRPPSIELGALAGRQQHILAGAADDFFEDLVLLLIVEELGHLKGAPAARLGRGHVVDLDGGDAVGVGVRKRIEHDVLNRAEDGRRGSHPQRQCQDCQKCESWTVHDASQPVTHVLPERLHDEWFRRRRPRRCLLAVTFALTAVVDRHLRCLAPC